MRVRWVLWSTLRLLHDLDAPVEVGGEAVASGRRASTRVAPRRRRPGGRRACPWRKLFHVSVFGGRTGGACAGSGLRGPPGPSRRRARRAAGGCGVECTICCRVSSSWKLSPALRKQQVVARGQADALVHGVVEALVRLADDLRRCGRL